MNEHTSELYTGKRVRYLLVGIGLVCAILVVGVFVADADAAQPKPVSFDGTISFGLPDEDRLTLRERGLSVPRVQVFYSQYTYVVGYEGVERAVETMQRPEHEQQFGRPLTVYVSDYSGTELTLTEDGYLSASGEPAWIDADEAVFVVGSEARTTVSEAIVPFGDEDDARAFVDEYGGEVVQWSELDAGDVNLRGVDAVREMVPGLHTSADERVESSRGLLDREVSVVVGQDEPTVQDAVEAAPANSTVVVPGGTYNEDVTVDRPLTLRGENATLRGDENGTVLRVTHSDVAVTGLTITGVGDSTRDEDAEERGEWDDVIEQGYGNSDAGIRVENASGVYVSNTSVDTPTSGVLFGDSPDSVVENLTVRGTDEPLEGFMGVLSIRSSLVVQSSVMDGGRDGVYLHRAPETVIRNNTFLGNRFGVHLMYTSDTLIADNVAREQTTAGVTIMTSPARNAVVDNDIRYAAEGIIPGGSRSYIAGNVVAFNDRGIMAGTDQSLYERNVVYGNDVGMRSGATVPSNVVRENDFVANERHAEAGTGPLRVWTDGDTGNYWQGAFGDSVGETLSRSYSPTDPTEQRFHRTDGTITLAQSPAARALAEIRTTSPGLRRGSIVDTAPLAEPVSPARIAALTNGTSNPTVGSTTGGQDDDE